MSSKASRFFVALLIGSALFTGSISNAQKPPQFQAIKSFTLSEAQKKDGIAHLTYLTNLLWMKVEFTRPYGVNTKIFNTVFLDPRAQGGIGPVFTHVLKLNSLEDVGRALHDLNLVALKLYKGHYPHPNVFDDQFYLNYHMFEAYMTQADLLLLGYLEAVNRSFFCKNSPMALGPDASAYLQQQVAEIDFLRRKIIQYSCWMKHNPTFAIQKNVGGPCLNCYMNHQHVAARGQINFAGDYAFGQPQDVTPAPYYIPQAPAQAGGFPFQQNVVFPENYPNPRNNGYQVPQNVMPHSSEAVLPPGIDSPIPVPGSTNQAPLTQPMPAPSSGSPIPGVTY